MEHSSAPRDRRCRRRRSRPTNAESSTTASESTLARGAGSSSAAPPTTKRPPRRLRDRNQLDWLSSRTLLLSREPGSTDVQTPSWRRRVDGQSDGQRIEQRRLTATLGGRNYLVEDGSRRLCLSA